MKFTKPYIISFFQNIKTFTASVVVGTLISQSVIAVEVFKWRDQTGKMHFSDQLPEEEGLYPKHLRFIEVIKEARISAHYDKRYLDPLKKNIEKPILLYTIKDCSVCVQAREYLKKQGLAFEEYNPTKTIKGYRDFEVLTGEGVPLIVFGSKKMHGWDSALFEKYDPKTGLEKK